MVCNGALETVQRMSIGKDWGETHVSYTEHLVRFTSPLSGSGQIQMQDRVVE